MKIKAPDSCPSMASRAPDTSAEVQMLRQEVKTLTDENSALKREVYQLRKRASAGGGGAPTKKARTAGQKKKLFEKWVKALHRECKKHKINNGFGCEPFSAALAETGRWSPEDFAEIFSGAGEKVQPTPSNKPTSVITILQFGSYEDVSSFFSGAEVTIPRGGYEVQIWRRRNFSKSYKNCDAPAELTGMDVHYNKSKHILSFQFSMELKDVSDW
eukprot:CAMPEP_0194285078 /NCGR_PEP_ID=MMETSP0169-20130528/29327_1 /TAXON_ID=218684 /ORGANISM="Corethron pennatum, Strain L29A3" /LENGTH=214 /DNA_ID=CAMNT_0039031107 /DNA_START=164 /DNA_END=808 /DNA_ORIENTATION=+